MEEEARQMNNNNGKIDPLGKWGIPAAFYRDDEPAFPPPGDPHCVEFYTIEEAGRGGLPDWLALTMPMVVLIVALLNGAVAALLLTLLH